MRGSRLWISFAKMFISVRIADVEVLGKSLFDTVENSERRRIVSQRLSQNVRSALPNQRRRAFSILRAPAGLVPRLCGRRARQHPALRGRHFFAGCHQFVRETGCDGRRPADPCAIEQHRQRRFNADQTRKALGSSPSRQQSHQRLRQAKRALRVIGEDPVMRRKRKFRAASQSQSRDRHRDGLARGLELAQPLAQPKEMIERDAVAFGRWRRHDHVVRGFQFGQISAGAKCRGLAGADDDARHIALRQPIGKPAEFLDRCVREDVHRSAGHVEDQVQDAVWRPFDPKLLQLRRSRHRFLSHFHYRSLVYYHACAICILACTPESNYCTLAN